jgi:hypothetical protein
MESAYAETPLLPGELSFVNQRAPSGPVVIADGLEMCGAAYDAMVPQVMIRPMTELLSTSAPVNQSALGSDDDVRRADGPSAIGGDDTRRRCPSDGNHDDGGTLCIEANPICAVDEPRGAIGARRDRRVPVNARVGEVDTAPDVVIRPIEQFAESAAVNQSAPSGPIVMLNGLPLTGKGVIPPDVVIRPMEPPDTTCRVADTWYTFGPVGEPQRTVGSGNDSGGP